MYIDWKIWREIPEEKEIRLAIQQQFTRKKMLRISAHSFPFFQLPGSCSCNGQILLWCTKYQAYPVSFFTHTCACTHTDTHRHTWFNYCQSFPIAMYVYCSVHSLPHCTALKRGSSQWLHHAIIFTLLVKWEGLNPLWSPLLHTLTKAMYQFIMYSIHLTVMQQTCIKLYN